MKIRRQPPPSEPKPVRNLIKGIARSLLGLFEEKLPVSKVFGKGKFATEVSSGGVYQMNLEQLCGGRSLKPCKHRATALVIPEGDGFRVTIQEFEVGQLASKDARTLRSEMVKVSDELFALSVAAVIEGGTRSKKGKKTPFTVRLDLPEPNRPKPKPVKAALAEKPARRKTEPGYDPLPEESAARSRRGASAAKTTQADNPPLSLNPQRPRGSHKVHWDDEPEEPQDDASPKKRKRKPKAEMSGESNGQADPGK